MTALWISLAAAIIPTGIYVLIFYWVDRYEREPLWLTTVAFFWGAVPAIIVSLFGELVLGWQWVDAPDSMTTALVEGALIAPIVEETAKAIALILIFVIMRHEFDGVLDGVVYGALIGFGFAMTENFFYFIGAYDEGGYQQLTMVIFLRSVLFGMNHAFYTGLTGIGLGLARISHGKNSGLLWTALGFSAAIITHSLHNLGASLAAIHIAGLGLSIIVAGASILLVAVAVLLSWRHERNCIRLELAEEINVLVTPQEYEQIVNRWRNPLHKFGATARADSRRRHDLVELALKKDRLRHGAGRETQRLMQDIAELRERLVAVA